ncbi:DUF2269 domain-containing protein [Leisingera caerulea]|uniref:DUF2269 domain-containing protein n=1 Tax=Leisingera caerulea TaxID=506591 RepID=A0ABY5WT89_LEICA|nr:DUF2269 domain-containing protein [Leisingera caerulea]UWQ57538.1 DUF2269 domain-containing protein [Leisingera caerulea]
MDPELTLRWMHVIGACVLLGTGAGIAFFMLMAHRTRNAHLVAHTAGVVVLADLLFTATAVIVQPVTGGLLAWRLGWPLSEGWLALSLGLYVLTGAFWLPVVWIQLRLRDLARAAAEADEALPARYHQLFAIWFACGFPAFVSVLAIIWLMLAQPDLGVWLVR